MREQVLRKSAVLRIAVAFGLVDEHGTGQRKWLEAIEGIEREEQPPIRAHLEVAQAQAARTVAGRDLGVHGMSVARRLACRSHFFRGGLTDREEAITVHASLRAYEHASVQKSCVP